MQFGVGGGDGLGHLFREELSDFKSELGLLKFRKYFRHVCLFGGETI